HSLRRIAGLRETRRRAPEARARSLRPIAQCGLRWAPPEMSKKPHLGRGLSALLGGEEASADPGLNRMMAIAILHPGRFQPRGRFSPDELNALAQSVKENGILQPILVRPHDRLGGHFEIVAGERRWRAAQLAQLHEVPILVRSLDDRGTLEIALIEN